MYSRVSTTQKGSLVYLGVFWSEWIDSVWLYKENKSTVLPVSNKFSETHTSVTWSTSKTEAAGRAHPTANTEICQHPKLVQLWQNVRCSCRTILVVTSARYPGMQVHLWCRRLVCKTRKFHGITEDMWFVMGYNLGSPLNYNLHPSRHVLVFSSSHLSAGMLNPLES